MQLIWDVWIMLTSLVRLAGKPVTNAPFLTLGKNVMVLTILLEH